MIRWHHADMKERMYCNLTDGKKIAMPRYYKLKLYSDGELSIINHHIGQKLLEQQAKEMAANPRYEEDKQAAKMQAFKNRDRKAAQRDKL